MKLLYNVVLPPTWSAARTSTSNNSSRFFMDTAAVYSHTEHYWYRTLFMYCERECSLMPYLVNSI